MRVLFFLVCLLTAGALWSDDQGPPVPWRVQAGVGLWFPTEAQDWAPFVEVGGFVQALDPAGPEFFDVGARVQGAWGRWAALMGVRHKLYFVPWSSTHQEVLVGWGVDEGRAVWHLGGRFGAGLPWESGDRAYPRAITDGALVWDVAWDQASGRLDSTWGLSLTLGAGVQAP